MTVNIICRLFCLCVCKHKLTFGLRSKILFFLNCLYYITIFCVRIKMSHHLHMYVSVSLWLMLNNYCTITPGQHGAVNEALCFDSKVRVCIRINKTLVPVQL